MVGMGVVEADNVFTALAAFTLDAHQFAWIDVVAVLRRVGASVAAARGGSYDAGAVVVHAAEQHATALVRIGFFAVSAEGFVVLWVEFQHEKRLHHRVTETEKYI